MSETTYPAEITALGDSIAKLTLVQAVSLKEYLKEQYKIEPAAGGVAIAAGPAVAVAQEKPAEQTEFAAILDAGFPADKKIGIIKVIRELTGLGLGEAKAFVEGAPKPIKEGVDKKTAEELKKKLEEAGAKVTIK